MSNENSRPAPGDKQRLITPVLAWFMAAMVLANTAGSMQGMLLPLYVSKLGATVAQVGLVFTLANIVPLVLQVFGGWFSDNYGRLRAVAVGSIGGVVGHIIIAFATSWLWVLVGLSIGSIARSLVGPSFSAFIAEQRGGPRQGLRDHRHDLHGHPGNWPSSRRTAG